MGLVTSGGRRHEYEAMIIITGQVGIFMEVFMEDIISDKSTWHLLDAYETELLSISTLCYWDLKS